MLSSKQLLEKKMQTFSLKIILYLYLKEILKIIIVSLLNLIFAIYSSAASYLKYRYGLALAIG